MDRRVREERATRHTRADTDAGTANATKGRTSTQPRGGTTQTGSGHRRPRHNRNRRQIQIGIDVNNVVIGGLARRNRNRRIVRIIGIIRVVGTIRIVRVRARRRGTTRIIRNHIPRTIIDVLATRAIATPIIVVRTGPAVPAYLVNSLGILPVLGHVIRIIRIIDIRNAVPIGIHPHVRHAIHVVIVIIRQTITIEIIRTITQIRTRTRNTTTNTRLIPNINIRRANILMLPWCGDYWFYRIRPI